jgi:hypothetical protein
MGSSTSFSFSINILNVIKVNSSNEGGGGGIVCNASKCITFEVHVGVENVVTKCGDVSNTNHMEKEKKRVREWEIN